MPNILIKSICLTFAITFLSAQLVHAQLPGYGTPANLDAKGKRQVRAGTSATATACTTELDALMSLLTISRTSYLDFQKLRPDELVRFKTSLESLSNRLDQVAGSYPESARQSHHTLISDLSQEIRRVEWRRLVDERTRILNENNLIREELRGEGVPPDEIARKMRKVPPDPGREPTPARTPPATCRTSSPYEPRGADPVDESMYER